MFAASGAAGVKRTARFPFRSDRVPATSWLAASRTKTFADVTVDGLIGSLNSSSITELVALSLEYITGLVRTSTGAIAAGSLAVVYVPW